MQTTKIKAVRPTDAEEAEIQRGIAADPDNPEWTTEELATARRVGRPKIASPKVPVTARYDADVVQAFRATGDGYQTRMNEALREYAVRHHML